MIAKLRLLENPDGSKTLQMYEQQGVASLGVVYGAGPGKWVDVPVVKNPEAVGDEAVKEKT